MFYSYLFLFFAARGMYTHNLKNFQVGTPLRNPAYASGVPYTIFSVVKLDLCIRTPLLDHILALKENTRTPRVHLVKIGACFFVNTAHVNN